MKKELAHEFVGYINHYMPTIEQTVYTHLGVRTKFDILQSQYQHYRSEVFISLHEDGKETTLALTANQLLSQLFESARLEIECGFNSQSQTGVFNVSVNYEHHYRHGRNGHEVMRFYIHFKTGEIEVEK